MAGSGKNNRELEIKVLEKVAQTMAAVNDAEHVDQVIVALYCLAVRLFPFQHRPVFIGSVDEKYREEIIKVVLPTEQERNQWWNCFYKGSAFRTFSRVLLQDVASSWLPCIPISARQRVYDIFFLAGYAIEVVQVVVPCLRQGGDTNLDTHICSNAERLVVLCLFDNDGLLKMVTEFSASYSEELGDDQLKQNISKVAQLVTSIPDKARKEAPKSLSSHLFFKRIASQLLHGAEVWDQNLLDEATFNNEISKNVVIHFVGDVCARICRRGSADVLLSEMIPQILRQVQSFLSSSTDLAIGEIFESRPSFRFWSKIMEATKDSYSVERMSEELLHQLASQSANDLEGYWILRILFGRICKRQTTIRSIFVEKFLLWKVFPICCLRWILHFAVLECAPGTTSLDKAYNAHLLSDTVQRLVKSWSKREFVQSTPIEQQAYITAALGICLEKLTKEDLDTTKDAMHSILQGISCRLESPVYLVRKMASSIALVFSKIIDPQKPLYLDDSFQEDTVDWEFGLVDSKKGSLTTAHCIGDMASKRDGTSTVVEVRRSDKADDDVRDTTIKTKKKQPSACKLIDPDEIIDPAALNESEEYCDDNGSEDSDASSDSSLQPYDLSDDDTDLKRRFSHLVDVVGALRKSDDAEGVERALDVAEKLVRASPDELKYIAGDLVRALVQVRCSDLTVEGEEESAEEKRQKALVALVVTSPLEALDSLNKLLYSPNLDMSQRIMILDVMTDAAHELSNTRISRPGPRQKTLISSSDQPWYMPRNIGPSGAGPWKEISSNESPLNWAYSYEREIPSRRGQIRRGKTRRWGLRSTPSENQMEWSQNMFPQYAAAFMLPAMQGFDKKRHGVDLLGRDTIVLGKLIHMLGVCIKCAAMHPEASVLASPLLDMLRSREIYHHAEAYVRRAVLFAASCVLLAIHPSYVASAMVEGNVEISKGLEWVRTWALQVAESDTDRECYTLSMTCLQLHAEMALQASRALETAEVDNKSKGISLLPSVSKSSITIPFSNVHL